MSSILVVDDEKKIQDILKKILTRAGYKVETVGGGEEALLKFKKQRFDLLITDLRMPGMDGAKMLSEIERLSNTTIKVIVVTGYPLDPATQKKVNEGSYILLEKPFENTFLLETIKELLSPKQDLR